MSTIEAQSYKSKDYLAKDPGFTPDTARSKNNASFETGLILPEEIDQPKQLLDQAAQVSLSSKLRDNIDTIAQLPSRLVNTTRFLSQRGTELTGNAYSRISRLWSRSPKTHLEQRDENWLRNLVNSPYIRPTPKSLAVAGIILATILTPEQNAEARRTEKLEKTDGYTTSIAQLSSKLNFDLTTIHWSDPIEQMLADPAKTINSTASRISLRPDISKYLQNVTIPKASAVLREIDHTFKKIVTEVSEKAIQLQEIIQPQTGETPAVENKDTTQKQSYREILVKPGDTASKLAGSYENLAKFIVDNQNVFNLDKRQAGFVDLVKEKYAKDPSFTGLKDSKDLAVVFNASQTLPIGAKVKITDYK